MIRGTGWPSKYLAPDVFTCSVSRASSTTANTQNRSVSLVSK